MPIKGKYFPSQVSGERIFLLVRRHWVVFASMIFFIIILLIPILVLIIYWMSNPDIFSGAVGNFVIVFGGIYSLAVFGLMLYGFVNYYLDVYIVTNKRIVDIKQNGFFNREIAELHLHQVQDVEARVEGFLQTIMHYGNIHIQTAGERENFVFEDVPHPYTLAKEIVELHEAQLESEYEPQVHHGEKEVDDYRPEDYFSPELQESANKDFHSKETETNEADETSDDTTEGGIKYLEESFSPKESQEMLQDLDKQEAEMSEKIEQPTEEPVQEFGFGAEETGRRKESQRDLNELSEGEEVSLDDKDREI